MNVLGNCKQNIQIMNVVGNCTFWIFCLQFFGVIAQKCSSSRIPRHLSFAYSFLFWQLKQVSLNNKMHVYTVLSFGAYFLGFSVHRFDQMHNIFFVFLFFFGKNTVWMIVWKILWWQILKSAKAPKFSGEAEIQDTHHIAHQMCLEMCNSKDFCNTCQIFLTYMTSLFSFIHFCFIFLGWVCLCVFWGFFFKKKNLSW